MLYGYKFSPRSLTRRGLSVVSSLLLASAGALAATLTITDEDGDKSVLEIQSGDYVRLTTRSDGDVFLDLVGFSVTVGDGGSTGGDSGSTGGDGGSTGGDGGSTGGDGGSTGGDGGSTGGDGGSTGGDGGSTGGDSGGSSSGSGSDVPTEGYCADYDPTQADCQAEQNFDPWIAGTGEQPYWIRSRLTEVFPFTLPARSEALETRYGYLQLTTGERNRNAATEDIFHMWFSETPHGPVLEGKKCEWYGTQAKTYFYWTQDSSLAKEMCDLGTASRILYVNFETRCYEPLYSGTCSDDNKRKSSAKYQFDVSRRIRGY
jgi:hypothetical protein